MTDLLIRTVKGDQTKIPEDGLTMLRGQLRGRACLKDEDGYDEARTIWNGMIDRSPGLVVRCEGAADVMRAVNFARENDLVLSVRGGGHNIAGNAVCDGGLQIDLTLMNSVRVDPVSRRAWVEPGALLQDVDRETQAFGLVLPMGINSTTGIAGLTLGGGFGWTSRMFGMTIDNLISADMVLADGSFVHVSEGEHPDLFWAIRGGGGNFGVVTSFEFRLHPMGPQVTAGLVVHPFEDAEAILRAYREIARRAPEELTCWVVMRKAPPLPFLPPEWHGREILVLAMCYGGSLDQGEEATRELRSLGRPIADIVGPMAFVDWQAIFDPLLTTGARNYWKSHDFMDLSDEVVAEFVEAIRTLPGPECEVFIGHLSGAMSRVPENATAYTHRNAHFTMNVHTRWQESRHDNACIGWARRLFRALEPYATGGAYVNFMPEDETDRIEKVYGSNFRRLSQIKGRYDPHNLFRMNQNIPPMH
ncbi:FAD-binding oxidoreductase [Microvirga pudoricolor]|uniref:FAD-binding oxidoreductase n=1 Tax=Microvirga pudoricolor TaxID=2778729 RepID=UPI00195186B3|nr:FAD-binding oxidoreductase [Microvirga pudoricolor]MBM6594276.1 FAD-binding oxidoreductase [Microvirga pudoricolor]